MDQIKEYVDKNPNEEVLSVQAFAGHGMNKQGEQVLVTNRFDSSSKFYRFIQVENRIRGMAKEMDRVYFIVLFACCRELYVPDKKMGDGFESSDLCKFQLCSLLHCSDRKCSSSDPDHGHRPPATGIANFTFLFGSDPSYGVEANTKFIQDFTSHISSKFEPQTWSL